MALIELKGIGRRFVMGDQTLDALTSVDLTIYENDYLAFIGSSGSGKSTLMNIIGCLDTPSAGEYWLKEKNIANFTPNELADVRNHDIGFIFQSFNLLPRSSALKNVMQPLIYKKVPLKQRKILAENMLKRVGLGDRMHHLPSELSGGQRQRVAVARALVTEPSILLADEPTGNLDSKTTKEMMDLFDELHHEGQTIIMVTHEPDIAEHCKRQVRMQDGQIVSDTLSASSLNNNSQ